MKDQRAILDQACRTTYHEQDDKIIISVYQDVGPHLEYAARCRREDRERRGAFGTRGEFHRTMSVPFNIFSTIAQSLGIPAGLSMQPGYSKRIMQELKKPEWKGFRTTNDRKIG